MADSCLPVLTHLPRVLPPRAAAQGFPRITTWAPDLKLEKEFYVKLPSVT